MPQFITRILDDGEHLKAVLLEKLGDPEVDKFLSEMVAQIRDLPFDMAPDTTVIQTLVKVETRNQAFGNEIAQIPGAHCMIVAIPLQVYLVPAEAAPQVCEIAERHGIEI